MKCLFLLLFFSPPLVAADFFYYEMPKDVWVAAALRRMGVKEPWRRASWLQRVVQYNRLESEKLQPGQVLRIPIDLYPPGEWDEKGYVERTVHAPMSLSAFLRDQGIQDPKREFSYVIDVLVANDLKVVEAKVRPGRLLKIPYEMNPDPKTLLEKPQSTKQTRPKKKVMIADKDYALPTYEPSFEQSYKDEESGRKYEYKKHHLSAALEIADYKYVKTDVISTEFRSALLRLSYRNLLAPPYWHFDLDAKLTMQSLARQNSAIDIQFYDFNVRAGLAFPWIPEPWRFTLMTGLYVSSMSVNDPDLRYSTVGFIQVYPEFRRLFASGDALAVYFRYSPTGRSPLSLSSEEYAGAVGLKWTRPWRVPLVFGIEASTLKFQSRSSSRKISNSSVSARFGIGI